MGSAITHRSLNEDPSVGRSLVRSLIGERSAPLPTVWKDQQHRHCQPFGSWASVTISGAIDYRSHGTDSAKATSEPFALMRSTGFAIVRQFRATGRQSLRRSFKPSGGQRFSVAPQSASVGPVTINGCRKMLPFDKEVAIHGSHRPCSASMPHATRPRRRATATPRHSATHAQTIAIPHAKYQSRKQLGHVTELPGRLHCAACYLPALCRIRLDGRVVVVASVSLMLHVGPVAAATAAYGLL